MMNEQLPEKQSLTWFEQAGWEVVYVQDIWPDSDKSAREGYNHVVLKDVLTASVSRINPHLPAHIWFSETRIPYTGNDDTPLLGVHNGVAYYLLYNGNLGDKRVNGGNALNNKILDSLRDHDGLKVIYGEISRLDPALLVDSHITFKQTPYDVRTR